MHGLVLIATLRKVKIMHNCFCLCFVGYLAFAKDYHRLFEIAFACGYMPVNGVMSAPRWWRRAAKSW